MPKIKNKMIVWITVDALLLAAIIVIIAFIVAQAKSNNAGNNRISPTPIPTPGASTSTPIPTEPAATLPPTNTPEPTEEPEPTEAATPTPEPTEAPAFKANAHVNVKVLNVRKGPGTEYDLVLINGENIQLTLDFKVQILDVSDKWFKIRYEIKGELIEGYAYGGYITPDADSGFTPIATDTNTGTATTGSYTPVLDATKYASLDTTWREWWYTYPNGSHADPVPSNLNKPMAEKFEKYDFYYDNLAVAEGDKVMYLTFDCGEKNSYTAQILDILKEKNVKVCFFVTKPFIEEETELVKRMKAEGHLVGNHTVDHVSLAGARYGAAMSVAGIEKQIMLTENAMKEKTGYEMDKYMRPPLGDYNERSMAVVHDLGYKTVVWSISIYQDYDVTYQDKVDTRGPIKSNHHNGSIVLMHAVSKTNADNLAWVIDYLREQGYRLGTIDELK